MVNPTNSDGNSSDTTDRGGKMVRNYKDEGSTAKDEQAGDQKKVDYMRFKITQKQKYNQL